MDATAIYQNLSAKFVNKIGSLTTDLGDPFLFIECDAIVEVGEYLRDDESLSFDFLESISGLDNGEHLDLVYHLFSYKHRHSIVLKIRAKGDHDTIPSCHQVWPAANWHEREAFDLFGFDFSNHPDLRRILLPDDWDGHPLRKNYEYPEEYHGIEHHRDDPLDQFKALDDLVAKAKVKAEEAKTKKAQSTETDSTDSTAAEPTVTESSSDSNNSEQETK